MSSDILISVSGTVVVPDWDGYRDYLTPTAGKLVPVDILDEILYEESSYAMVNLPKFVDACVEILSSPLKVPRFIISDFIRRLPRDSQVISEKCEVYVVFGFTIYLMHLADYLKRKKPKKKK